MMTVNDFDYYYNTVPSKGLCRNNLIYTSLISKDKTVFCQWFFNDTAYHGNKNKVVDPALMDEKWRREVYFLEKMQKNYPEHVPEIIDVDFNDKKIYFEIEGSDLWEQNGCYGKNYSKVLNDWQEQLLQIMHAYKSLGIFKYSLHPSSYFITDGKLKSINHFFCYEYDEKEISIYDVSSHISEERLEKLKTILHADDNDLLRPRSFSFLQRLALESFRTNFSDEFINQCLDIFEV